MKYHLICVKFLNTLLIANSFINKRKNKQILTKNAPDADINLQFTLKYNLLLVHKRHCSNILSAVPFGGQVTIRSTPYIVIRRILAYS